MAVKKILLVLSVVATLASAHAMAREVGDILVRVGIAGIYPTAESDDLDATANGNVEVQSALSLGLSLTYMVNNNLGIGVLGSWPFEHDIDPKGSSLTGLTGNDTVATTRHLPPTVTLQWHFPAMNNLHPFIGAGINYTYFFDEETTGGLGGTGAKIDIDDSIGLAVEAGVDVELQDNWLVSGQVWYARIEPEAKITGGTLGLNEKIDVAIDPWVFMLSIGKKF